MAINLGSSSQVAHVWAQQSQHEGRGGTRGNIYFTGPALYSYGSHFLVGYIMPDGVALITTDTYSPTTSGHVADARGAVRHRTSYAVPKLTDMRYTLDAVRDAMRSGNKADLAAARPRVLKALEDRALSIGDEAAAYLGGLVSIKPNQFARIKAKAERAAEAAKLERQRRELASLVGEAKALAAQPLEAFKATWPEDADNDWTRRQFREFGSRLAKLHKAAKAHTGARVTAKVWERVKAWREHARGLDERLVAAHVGGLVASFEAWKRGEGERPDPYRYDYPHPALVGMKEALEEGERAEREAEARRDYEAWKRDEGGRPERWIAYLSEAEQAEIDADIEAEKAAQEKAYLAWKADPSQPAPPSHYFLVDSRLKAAYPAAWMELSRVETAKREAAKAALLATGPDLWRRGESRPDEWPRNVPFPPRDDGNGGALLRVRGDTLETSQGASVPLREAVRVFQFVKLCRERGEGWSRNGRQLPVGHFAVDRVDPDGSFRAGCHRINWPEIEAAAAQADVLSCPASDAALVPSG